MNWIDENIETLKKKMDYTSSLVNNERGIIIAP
jgi:hypothetical protein